MRKIIDISAKLFAEHPINVARRKAGKNAATQVWLWGQGHAPAMPTFDERFGPRAGAGTQPGFRATNRMSSGPAPGGRPKRGASSLAAP